MSTDFTDNLATMDRARQLLLIQQEARGQGAAITLDQAARVLGWYEFWETVGGRPVTVTVVADERGAS